MLKQYTNGKRTINASQRAYELFYKKQGFKELKEYIANELIEDINEAHDLAIKENTTDLIEKTVDELRAIAKEKNLEGYSKLKKEELIELIEGE